MSKFNPGPVVVDIVGTQLGPDDVRRLRHPLCGGVILFARNFVSRRQLVELTDAIRDLREDLLICVDHEGGRVQRFRDDGFTVLPAARRLGELWDRDVLIATRTATALGYVLAAELRACGVDLSFTPVLDLDWGHSEVIGDRALHHDARVVTLLAKSVNHGLALAGMANCGKHFPGHGWASADSHLDLPVDERSLDDVLNDDAAPYDWLGLSLAAVMPAHLRFPAVDQAPAGFSRIWLQDILRGRLGFDGVIFSDDLAMAGAVVAGTVVERARAALSAGCDYVLICNQPAQADELLEGLCVTGPEGLDALQGEPARASRQRRRRLFPTAKAPGWDKLQARPAYQRALHELREQGLIV